MNFCPNCGTELNQNVKFCSSCGHSIQDDRMEQPVQEASATAETIVKETNIKRIPKKWFIAAALIVVVILGTSAYAFNLFTSPKSLYLMSEYKTFKQLKSDWAEVYGEQYDYQKMLLEQPSRNQLKLTGNIEIPDNMMDQETAIVQEVLSKLAITIDSEQDIKNNISKVKAGLQVDGTNTLDFNIYQSPKLISASVPVLYDKAFYLNTNQFGQFMRNIDQNYDGAEKLELNDLNWNRLQFTEKELDSLSKRYGKFLVEKLADDNFSMKKGVSYDYNDETLKLREITLTLTPKETEVFLKALFDQMIRDEELHAMLASRLALIGKANQFDQNDESLTDPKQIKVDIKDSLKKMKSGIDEYAFPDGIKSVLLINKKEQIIDRTTEFSIKDAADDDSEKVAFVISAKNVPYDKSNHFREWKVEILPKADPDSKLRLFATVDRNNEQEQRVEDTNIGFYYKEYGDVQADMELNLHSEFQEYKKGKVDVKRDFELVLDGVDYYGPFNTISGTITEKGETNLKKLTSNQKLDLALTMDDGSETGNVKLGFASTSAIKKDLQISPLNTKDGVNVADITESDIYDIQEQIGSRFMGLLEELGLDGDSGYQNNFSLFDDSYNEEDNFDSNNYTSFNDQSGYELFAQSCASCHGQNLEGGVGPDLQTVGDRLSYKDVNSIIYNGQGAMPAGLLQGDDARKVARWLTENNYRAEQYSYEDESYADEEADIDVYSAFSNSCASCHGQNMEGGVGPDLQTVGSRLSAEGIYSVIVNGQGAMPAGLVDDQTAQAIADWLTTEFY